MPIVIQETSDEAERGVLELLSRREHSRTELTHKLRARGFEHALIERVLDALVARGILSDERFIEQYLTTCVRKGYGPVRIRAELKERGVDADLINTWLEDDAVVWRERLRHVAEKRFGRLRQVSRDKRELNKRARFLEYRGFPTWLVRDFLLNDK